MAFEDAIRAIAESIPELRVKGGLQTEEATKQALILPFIEALGYSIRDTLEVQPESTADFGTRKGGKVDYAILSESTPIVIVECKQASSDLSSEKDLDQLVEYFSTTAARVGSIKGLIGILTNGIAYKFFTDNPENPNVMDKNPFWEVDLLSLDDKDMEQLGQFAKGFNASQTVEAASHLRFISLLKHSFALQYDYPDGDFLRALALPLHSGNFNDNARRKFRPLVKEAFTQFVREQMFQAAESFTNRLADRMVETTDRQIAASEPEEERTLADTVEEVEAYKIVRAILGDVVAVDRVYINDTVNYCAVYLDKAGQPLCRLYFNGKRKRLHLFDGNQGSTRVVTQYDIDNPQDVHNYADQIRETARRYLES